jgi:dTDP-4-dehydrorhamnose reductase
VNVLVFGGKGMLGHKLVQRLSGTFKVYYTLRGSLGSVDKFKFFDRRMGFENVDVENEQSVRDVFEQSEPDVVINAVGVIKQVGAVANVETTLSINSIFPHRLARICREYGARLISVSTDCIFTGNKGMYREVDAPDALDLYGQSKHWGEVVAPNCLTLRTSIVGRELATSHGLVEWLFSNRGGRVKGYSKAIYSGFPTVVFADILVDIIERHPGLCGVFHVSSDPISKFDILKKIDRGFGLAVEIEEDHGFVIDRSLDSSAFRRSTGFEPPMWDEMIGRMVGDPTPYDKWNDLTN